MKMMVVMIYLEHAKGELFTTCYIRQGWPANVAPGEPSRNISRIGVGPTLVVSLRASIGGLIYKLVALGACKAI